MNKRFVMAAMAAAVALYAAGAEAGLKNNGLTSTNGLRAGNVDSTAGVQRFDVQAVELANGKQVVR